MNEKGTLSRIYDLEIEGVLWILGEEMKTSNGWDHSFIRKLIEKHSSKLPLVLISGNTSETLVLKT